VSEDYVHRIGRTGRAEREGIAISLVCIDEREQLKDIERLLKHTIRQEIIEGYEPDPSIKAEPILRGRNNQNQRQGRTYLPGKSWSNDSSPDPNLNAGRKRSFGKRPS
jgi:ATP-dependent RNA helicase RhlE